MQILSKTNKSILTEMVRTDFKLRYQNSVLGYLWSLLRPLLLSFTLYIVFVKFLKVGGDIRHYAPYLLLGIMCWTFFIEVTTGGVGSVVGKGDLIRKISIPRYLTVLSSSSSALINFVFNFIVLAIIMIVAGVEVQVKLVWLVPLLLIQLYVFSLSLAFILSALFVKFRDVSFIWEVFTQMFFYVTPILYPIGLVLSLYPHAKLLLINPLAQIIQDLRHIIVTPQTQTTYTEYGMSGYVYTFAIVIVLGVFSVWYFRREARFFAENV
jgi:ABC-2 type transport system permease protein